MHSSKIITARAVRILDAEAIVLKVYSNKSVLLAILIRCSKTIIKANSRIQAAIE